MAEIKAITNGQFVLDKNVTNKYRTRELLFVEPSLTLW